MSLDLSHHKGGFDKQALLYVLVLGGFREVRGGNERLLPVNGYAFRVQRAG